MTIRSVSLSVFILSILFLASSAAPGLQATASGDDASLRAYIQAANNGGSDSITLTGDLTLSAALPQIRGNIIINGGGHSVSGAGEYRIFDVNGGTLTLTNVTLTEGNGGAAYGGAIRLLNGAEVTIDGSTLSDNKATHGGAIAASGSSVRLSVKDSSFIGNIAEKSAGAIYANGGTVTIMDSNFVKNCAVRFTNILKSNATKEDDREQQTVDADGCVYITFYRSRLEDEIPLEGLGGAIRLLNGARGIVETSAFSENRATDGGAIATSSGSVLLNINQSSFISNEAASIGGAIYLGGGSTEISNSSFRKNAADSGGGALTIKGDKLEVTNSTISENQSGSGAGAIEVFHNAAAIFTHVTFVNNWSLYRDSSTIDNRQGGKLYLRNSIVASRGRSEDCVGGFTQTIGTISPDGSCAIRASEDPLLGELSGAPAHHPLLDHSPAIDAADPAYCPETDQIGTARPAGGGCDSGAIEARTAEAAPKPIVPPPSCALADQIIAANTDRAFEGCPAGRGVDTIVFERNILLFAPLPAITSAITIEGNGHTISGDKKFRIFDVDRGELTINNLTMLEGRASSGRGGAIRLQNGGRAIVSSSRFISNSADAGGAIAVDGQSGASSRLTVSDSHFQRNSAGRIGGAIDLNFGGAVINKSSFIDNSAGQSGGAINLLNYPRLEVTNSSFINNNAGWGGGALSVENGARATLTHITVHSNTIYTIQRLESGFGARSAINLRNSLIAGSPYMLHCKGPLTENVGNLILGGSCEPMLRDDPMLEEPTDTATFVSPLPGSPAIRAADPRFCPETDQVGQPRAIVGPCDIGAIESIPVQRAISDCEITTIHVLNFRDAPNGAKIGQVQHNQTLTPLARTPNWFQVEHDSASGWISADYVVAQGNCA